MAMDHLRLYQSGHTFGLYQFGHTCGTNSEHKFRANSENPLRIPDPARTPKGGPRNLCRNQRVEVRAGVLSATVGLDLFWAFASEILQLDFLRWILWGGIFAVDFLWLICCGGFVVDFLWWICCGGFCGGFVAVDLLGVKVAVDFAWWILLRWIL